MKIILAVVVFAALLFLVFLAIAIAIARGHGRWESEDDFNPPPLKVHRKTPKPVQTIDTSTTVAANLERAAALSRGLSETMCVGSVMHRQPYYCLETQPVDEVREMMRELHIRDLAVLDSNMRVVGTVTIEDLNRGKHQDSPQVEA